jgi:hypothetical protein
VPDDGVGLRILATIALLGTVLWFAAAFYPVENSDTSGSARSLEQAMAIAGIAAMWVGYYFAERGQRGRSSSAWATAAVLFAGWIAVVELVP